MLKRIAALVLISIVFLAGCGTHKYDDAQTTIKEFIKINEDYIAAVEKVENSRDLVQAIETYSENMSAITGKMSRLYAKFPEIKNPKTAPRELEAEMKKMEGIGIKLFTVSMSPKIIKFSKEKDVLEAQKKAAEKLKEARK